jgi:serine protease inhibitor
MKTFKQLITEAKAEPEEAGEYDFEGDMAKTQLKSIIRNSMELHDMLEDDDNLPEWVQSKITLAEDYITTVYNYMTSEADED